MTKATILMSQPIHEEGMKYITSRGNFSSLSSLVTSIETILAETFFGFGRCEYHFQVHAPPPEIRRMASTADAIILG